MILNKYTSLSLLVLSGLIASLSGCGKDASSTGGAVTSDRSQLRNLSDRIQYAQAVPTAEGIELSLGIEGSKSATSEVTGMTATDVAMVQEDKDGKLVVSSLSGMDIRGSGECLDINCNKVRVSLYVNESGFSTDPTDLEITVGTKVKCGVKSINAAEDALFLGLKKSLHEKNVVSLVEKTAGTSKFFAISGKGEAAPFFRADLQPSAKAEFDLIEIDTTGSVTKKPVAVKVESAELTKEPFQVKTVLSHEGQASTEMTCLF